ncbi:MAG: hypothetical protein IPM39_25045 [Chloroflexi bacterium]|nr:hypothetical protein [Chloroflexota bacterium]
MPKNITQENEPELTAIYIIIENGVIEDVYMPVLDSWEKYVALDLDTDDPYLEHKVSRLVSMLHDADCTTHVAV